jgi:hypothetical protein
VPATTPIDPDCGGVKAMKDRTIDVLRHDIADVADLEIYDGPDTDISGTQTVVTVICGEVSGELDRVVSRDEDGALVIVYEARIDGLRVGTGAAKVESSSADELRCLATVAGFLADEVDRLTASDHTAVTGG